MKINMRTMLSLPMFIAVLVMMGGVLIFGQLLIASDEKFRYDSGQRRDPFMSLVKASLQQKQKLPSFSLERIKLQGLIVDPLQGSSALIDDEFYQENDMLGPYKIETITENHVIFTFEDQKFKVNLEE